MKNLYYLNHALYQSGDTLTAWNFVKTLISNNSNIKTITFLVNSSTQFSFLEELGLRKVPNANYNVPNQSGVCIQVRTLKTYRPNYLFAGNQPSEILVAIALDPEQLYQFEDCSDIEACVVVPWILDDWEGFLSIYQAEDINTGIKNVKPQILNQGALNAIKWLMCTSFPNQGYNHPCDSNRLKQISRALKLRKIQMSYESVVYACLHNGYLPSAARKTADYFVGNKPIRLSEPFDKGWMNKVIDGKLPQE